MTPLPQPNYDHLLAISGPLGTYEHADGDRPRLEHGLCSDDVARVVALLSREPSLTPGTADLLARSVMFLDEATRPDGRCLNRRTTDGHWKGVASLEDCWGRTVRAFGELWRGAPDDRIAERAATLFRRAARHRTPYRRSQAFAAQGAAAALAAAPGDPAARALLIDTATALDLEEVSPQWRWIEPRLAYANAALADALVAAGAALNDDRLLASGLRKLSWLVAEETADDHLSPTPVGGRGPDDPRPGFDQQPIEVAALAEACARAWEVTGDALFRDGLERAANWFLGRNDVGVPMIDLASGGGYDGLTPAGPNRNMGAESTIAAQEALQFARACVPMAR